MKVEDIIEGLNRHIENRRLNNPTTGHLVLQRVITPNLTFKAYKSYEAILWFINRGRRYRVVTVKHTDKVLDGQEELMERKLNIGLSLSLFNWIGSKSYNQVLMGIYKGEENEVIEI